MFVMKFLPSAKKRSNPRPQNAVVSSTPSPATKKLWRLPHIFDNVLELPFHSDVDVSIEETSQFLRFVASSDNINISKANARGVRAQAIEILPGMTKIVIKGMDGADLMVKDHQHQQLCSLSLYLWRFRLPEWIRPEMATAVCSGGKLVVTVPKIE